MRCIYHDYRDNAIRLARAAKAAGQAYQTQIELARVFNHIIVARLQEG